MNKPNPMTNMTNEQLIEKCEQMLAEEYIEDAGGCAELLSMILTRFKALSTGKDGVICPHCDEYVDLKQPAPVSVEDVIQTINDIYEKGDFFIFPADLEPCLNKNKIRAAFTKLLEK